MSKPHDLNSEEADRIYQTLLRHYPLEIKRIQQLQAQDMSIKGYISEKTNQLMDELMDRVVRDNKEFGRT